MGAAGQCSAAPGSARKAWQGMLNITVLRRRASASLPAAPQPAPNPSLRRPAHGTRTWNDSESGGRLQGRFSRVVAISSTLAASVCSCSPANFLIFQTRALRWGSYLALPARGAGGQGGGRAGAAASEAAAVAGPGEWRRSWLGRLGRPCQPTNQPSAHTCCEVESRPGGLVGHRHQQHQVGGKQLQREGRLDFDGDVQAGAAVLLDQRHRLEGQRDALCGGTAAVQCSGAGATVKSSMMRCGAVQGRPLSRAVPSTAPPGIP